MKPLLEYVQVFAVESTIEKEVDRMNQENDEIRNEHLKFVPVAHVTRIVFAHKELGYFVIGHN